MSFNHSNPFNHIQLIYRPNADRWSFECESCGLKSFFASSNLEFLVAEWHKHLTHSHGVTFTKETCSNCNDDGYISLHGTDMFIKCPHH